MSITPRPDQLNRDGKINKAAIIREVVSDPTKPYESKKIVAAANARLSKFDFGIREGIEVKPADVAQTIQAWRKKFPESNGHTTIKIPQPTTVPPPDSYNPNELLCAARFLQLCGHSQHRAISLLKLVSEITKKEETNVS